jgi:hypothetical protein
LKLLILIFLLAISLTTYSQQENYLLGTGIGIGSFNGDFPSQTIFGSRIFLQSPSPVKTFNHIQIHFTFAQKIEKFLPGSYQYKHYSYFTSLGISGGFNQQFNRFIDIEENIGLILLNDRSFDDINVWNYGILLNFGLSTNISRKFDLAFSLEYGITLNNTNSSFFLAMVGLKYNF